MKKIFFLIGILYVGCATFAQTIVIDDEDGKDGPVLRFNNNKSTNTVYFFDSTLRIDSICGLAVCVCNIDKGGKLRNLKLLWFFQRYPTNGAYMNEEIDTHLSKLIVDNLEIQIRKYGVFVCPSDVNIKGTRQNFGIPIVINRSRRLKTR